MDADSKKIERVALQYARFDLFIERIGSTFIIIREGLPKVANPRKKHHCQICREVKPGSKYGSQFFCNDCLEKVGLAIIEKIGSLQEDIHRALIRPAKVDFRPLITTPEDDMAL